MPWLPRAGMDHAVDYASLILSYFGQFFVDTKRHPRLASYAARHRGCAQIWFHQGTWIVCLILVVICAWTYITGASASNYPIVLLSFATFLAFLVGIVGEWALLTSRAVGSYLYMVFYYGSWVAMLWSSAMCYIDAPRVRSRRITAPHQLPLHVRLCAGPRAHPGELVPSPEQRHPVHDGAGDEASVRGEPRSSSRR